MSDTDHIVLKYDIQPPVFHCQKCGSSEVLKMPTPLTGVLASVDKFTAAHVACPQLSLPFPTTSSVPCARCAGKKQVRMPMNVRVTMECPHCEGSGKEPPQQKLKPYCACSSPGCDLCHP